MTHSASVSEIKLRYWAVQRRYNDFYACLDEGTMQTATSTLEQQMRDIEQQHGNDIECMRQKVEVIEAAVQSLSRLYDTLLMDRESDMAFRDHFDSLSV